MALALRIENEIKLPDGGPVSITVSARRNIDIGRDTHLDWTLPDPTRHISGKHCEVRYLDGGYWLHDVSTNGTFVNGSDHRMQAPHRLRTGDRFTIGHYIVVATVEGEDAAQGAGAAPAAPANYQELWASDGNVAPPIDRAGLKPARNARPVNADFLDWAADVPDTPSTAPANPFETPAPVRGFSPMSVPAPDQDSWASGPPTPKPPPPPPPAAVPSPRRPVWVASEPDGPWSGEIAASASPPPQTPLAEEPSAKPEPAGPAPRPQTASGAMPSSFAQRIAQGARVPEEYFTNRSPDELAELFGQVMRLVVESTMQLLTARGQAKRMARSANHTMIEAFNNNPLKFSPSAEDAIKIMFGAETRSYLDAYRAFAQSYDDLKAHQIKTYSAMQHALLRLMGEIDPQTIEREAAESRGIGAMMTSRKAKMWDAYVARWQTMSRGDNSGAVDSFMAAFSEYYDRHDETQ